MKFVAAVLYNVNKIEGDIFKNNHDFFYKVQKN